MTTIKEGLLGTDEQNRVAQENIDKYNKFKRGAAAAESLMNSRAGDESSDAMNITTYGKPTKLSDIDSAKFVGKALDAADNEKAREATRGIQSKKKGGVIKKFRHHDGIAQRGKTRA